MKNIPHHLIGYLDSTYIKHNVIDYRNKAVELIDNLLQNDIIPILGLLYTLFYIVIVVKVLNDIYLKFKVGGTHYYIHSILWDSLIDDKQTAKIDFIKNETDKSLHLIFISYFSEINLKIIKTMTMMMMNL
jgi:tRNA A37 N6-isopentenylltransferase MiaA